MREESAAVRFELLVEVLRGEMAESWHHGAIAVCDPSGALLASAGDPSLATNIRSACKPFQAMPLLLAGGAERYALTDQEIALTCSSHIAEPCHVATAEALLAREGFTEADLRCGPHEPVHGPSAEALAASGRAPGPIHNNCSGKHAGMLLACRLKGYDPADYWRPESPLQKDILDVVARYTSRPPTSIRRAVDGCSLPAYHLPLDAVATAYARLLETDAEVWPLTAAERAARDRLTGAMRGRPEYVRGTGGLTTDLMRSFDGRLLAKEGAEAFYAMALPPESSTAVRAALGLPAGPARATGIALKLADGAERGRPPVILEALRQLGVAPETWSPALEAAARPEVRNARGDVVGRLVTVFRLAR